MSQVDATHTSDRRIRELYDAAGGDFDLLAVMLRAEFGWTVQQSYIATEFLYRPPNYN